MGKADRAPVGDAVMSIRLHADERAQLEELASEWRLSLVETIRKCIRFTHEETRGGRLKRERE